MSSRAESLGLAKGKVILKEWQTEWASRFREERARVLTLLAKVPMTATVEHVGGTAIHSMPAKPIVDIVVGFRTVDELQKARRCLQENGYDYVPAANRPGMVFLARGVGDMRMFHYHLVIVGSRAWDNLVVVRDYLRRYRAAARAHADVKRVLAKRHAECRIAYARAKSPYIEAIAVGALNRHRAGQAQAAVVRTRARERLRRDDLRRPVAAAQIAALAVRRLVDKSVQTPGKMGGTIAGRMEGEGERE